MVTFVANRDAVGGPPLQLLGVAASSYLKVCGVVRLLKGRSDVMGHILSCLDASHTRGSTVKLQLGEPGLALIELDSPWFCRPRVAQGIDL